MTRSKQLPLFLENLFKILFIVLIFIPKITFYQFPGYWQGIRFEELFVLLFIYVIFKKKTALNFDHIGKPFLIFFLYFLFSSLIGYLNGVETNLLFYFRYIEYIVILLILNSININEKFLVNVFKGCIIINLIFVLLQIKGFVGVVSSKGYFAELPFGIPYGLFGGAWELSICMGLSYFIIANFSKNYLDRIIYLIPVIFLIYISENKGNAIAFILSFSFFLLKKDKKLTIILALIGSLIFIFLLKDIIYQNFMLSEQIDPFILTNEKKYFITKITNLDLNFLYNSLYNLFVYKKPLYFYEIPSWDYLSFMYRINLWLEFYNNYLINFFTIFFGTGIGNEIYIESFVLRALFSFGIVGVIIILFLARNLPMYLFIYLFFSGITLDLFISIKIFIITSVLIFLHKKARF